MPTDAACRCHRPAHLIRRLIRGRCGPFDRIIGNIPFLITPASHRWQKRRIQHRLFRRRLHDMGGMTAAASQSDCWQSSPNPLAESPARNHSLRQHTASGMADIDAQTCHKRIDLL